MPDAAAQPDPIPVRLTPLDCAVVAALFLAALAFGPMAWDAAESFQPGDNYRVSANLRDDYALFRRWAELAAARHDVLVVGDSTVWGRYVERDDTWPAQLNRLSNTKDFANLGLDGLHNVALLELLRHYGGAIRAKRVILHLNPLWMTSPAHDLTGDRKAESLNHPRLLPQFDPALACYAASLDERIGVAVERTFRWAGLVNHVVLSAFGGKGLSEWMAEHPYSCPATAPAWRVRTDAAFDGEEEDTTSDWSARNMRPQNWPWVPLEESRQWAAFRAELALLESRGNSVFVLVGPFNPHLLTPESLARYRTVLAEMTKWLDANHPDCFVAPDLPSGEYGDSSHPLAAGYRRAAHALFADARFQRWMKKSAGQ